MRKQAEKATGGLWEIGEVGSDDENNGTLAIFGDKKYRQPSQVALNRNAACICLVSPKESTTNTDRANARLIVKAVNLYPAFKKLEKAALWIQKEVGSFDEIDEALKSIAAIRKGKVQK